jgi:surfactin synthase thioesterase subunit
VRARLESCLARYLPRPYADSPVLFVQARETLPGYFNPAVVWRRVLQGPVQIEEVPGAHLQLVSAQAGVLAALIDKALEHTQTQTQTKPQSPPQAQQKVRQLRPVSPLARPR